MENDCIGSRHQDTGSTVSYAGVRDILEAIGSELIGLGEASGALQAMLRPTHRPDREGLQALDMFTQRLFALSEFLSTLTPLIDEGCQVDPAAALAAVCLSDMARRLAAGSYPAGLRDAEPRRDEEVDAGVMDLF